MSSTNSGAVFFLGSRAHYQVLQQPERPYDVENGNTSTESIYQNPTSVPALWNNEKVNIHNEVDNADHICCKKGNADDKEIQDASTVAKRRPTQRQNEIKQCENINDMKPAQLNAFGDSETPKAKPSRRRAILGFLTSLARRKRRLDNDMTDQMHYLQHLESAFTCTYRDSCRCFECQSRYFECDVESDEYSSDDEYFPRYFGNQYDVEVQPPGGEDDEVFVDTLPEDNTSTDLLIDNKPTTNMSISSDESFEESENNDENLPIEMAAGTPIILNYLLTHPLTCNIQ